MDIELHSPHYDPFGAKSIFELQQEMAGKYAVFPPLKDDRFLCSFGHIFAGGYSAGYYSYKWAGKNIKNYMTVLYKSTFLKTNSYFICRRIFLYMISFPTNHFNFHLCLDNRF